MLANRGLTGRRLTVFASCAVYVAVGSVVAVCGCGPQSTVDDVFTAGDNAAPHIVLPALPEETPLEPGQLARANVRSDGSLMSFAGPISVNRVKSGVYAISLELPAGDAAPVDAYRARVRPDAYHAETSRSYVPLMASVTDRVLAGQTLILTVTIQRIDDTPRPEPAAFEIEVLSP